MTSNIEVIVSPRALQQFERILNYTERQWGSGQRAAYRKVLEDAFRRIGDFPDIGRPVEGGPPGLRELILRHHTIVYRRDPNRITILRVRSHRRRRTSPAPSRFAIGLLDFVALPSPSSRETAPQA